MNVFDQVLHISARLPLETDIQKIAAGLGILKDAEICAFLTSPHVLLKDKVQVLVQSKLDPALIQIVIESAALQVDYQLDPAFLIDMLVGAYQERHGIPLVRIELIRPMDNLAREKMEKILHKKLFPHLKHCNFLYSYNEQLIGGILIRHLDQVWDASWLYFLTAFKEAAITN